MSTPTRPSAGALATNAAPRTPQRGISSSFSSPGFRSEEDTVVIDIGTRHFRAGLANYSTPRCILEYGPEQSRRLGDYRRWLPDYEDRTRPIKSLDAWTRAHELWQLDIRNFDIGFMEDKLERAIRTAFTDYLLLDAKGRKAVLVMPTMTAHVILSRILGKLFHNFQISSVVLVPPPTMAAVSAGQRSGLVVDIGWHETVITAVYEYREVAEYRSTRAMKRLLGKAAIFFDGLLNPENADQDKIERTGLDFQYVEELTTQYMWCRSSSDADKDKFEDSKVSIRLPLGSSKAMSVQFSSLSQPVESALFEEPQSQREQDDQDQSLNFLLYNSLIRLPSDIRSICMSRIMFTGGGSNIPGLKSRLLNDLGLTVKQRGWSLVWGSTPFRKKPVSDPLVASATDAESETVVNPPETAFEEQIHDPYEERIHQAILKSTKPEKHGEIRGIETMGAFAGASLATALRVKSLVEIERDVFLQHGLAGPRTDRDSTSARTKSLGGAFQKLPTVDSSSWTLGAWA